VSATRQLAVLEEVAVKTKRNVILYIVKRVGAPKCLGFGLLFVLLCLSGCRTYPRSGAYEVLLEDKTLDWCTVRLMRARRDGRGIRIEVEANEGLIVQTDVEEDGFLINSTIRYLSQASFESMNVRVYEGGRWKVVRAVIGEEGLLEVLFDDVDSDAVDGSEEEKTIN
jgi:hypothetical protein